MCLYPVKIFTHPKRLESDFQYLENGEFVASLNPSRSVTVKCGKCLQCMEQASNEWAYRIMFESFQYKKNAFITLTYNNENLPADKSVSRREVQLFLKSFRKALSPLKVRFFASGEYGSKNSRPHYHIIIFNWFPSDALYWQTDKGRVKLFRSPFLEKIWKKGFSSVGELTYESARYCAKYMQKYNFLNKNTSLTPPFVQMSNRPGIGYNFIYNSDLISDKVYLNGNYIKIPRYFLKVMERDGISLEDFKARRQRNGEHVANCTDVDSLRDKYRKRFLRPSL